MNRETDREPIRNVREYRIWQTAVKRMAVDNVGAKFGQPFQGGLRRLIFRSGIELYFVAVTEGADKVPCASSGSGPVKFMNDRYTHRIIPGWLNAGEIIVVRFL
jgi:hypothetical protein